MLKDHAFWFGIGTGFVITYLYHRIAGIPSNAPAKGA